MSVRHKWLFFLLKELSLFECDNRAAVRGGGHADNLIALFVHFIGLFLNELGTLYRVLGESDDFCLIHILIAVPSVF